MLRKRAVNAVDELKQGLGEISFLTNPTEGEIRIGCTQPMTTLAAATILQRMSSRYPRFVFHVTAEDTRALHQLLRDREIELVISRIASPHTDEDIQSEPLFEDELAVLASKQHPLARRKKLSLRDLVEERWIFGPDQYSFLRSFIEEAFADASLRVPPATVVSGSSYLGNSLLCGRSVSDHPAGGSVAVSKAASHPDGLGRLLANNQTTGRAAMAEASNHEPNRFCILHHCP